MVTTRRTVSSSGFYTGNVGLLEKNPDAVPKNTVNPAETPSEAKARTSGNFARIMNYDRYEETFGSAAVATAPAPEDTAPALESAPVANSDEDTRPSSTTMQFGDIDIGTLYGDMKKNEKETYRLTAKGKLLVVLYSLAVAVIMALIIINTGVWASVNRATVEKAEQLAAIKSEYAAVNEKIAEVSDSAYITEIAENDLGMIIG